MAKMTKVTKDGTRLEQLKTLAETIACAIDDPDDTKSLAQLARQYRETIKEIEEIEGATTADDEIEKIMSERKSNGKAGAVRKNRA